VDRRLTWLDVFTALPLTGNALAVVHDADGVDDATMHAFARETRLSETTFVQTAEAEGASYRNRIWMTEGEIPFAGHPSLGTAVAVAIARGEREAEYVQQTRAGLQPIRVERRSDVLARASMLQELARFGPEVDPGEVLAAAGIARSAAVPELPPQVVWTGVPQLIAPVGDAAALAQPEPNRHALRALLHAHDALTLYLAAWDATTGTAQARSFFAEGDGVTEDPATGSAAGPLLAYLHARAPTPSRSIRAWPWGARAGWSARSRVTACASPATSSPSRRARSASADRSPPRSPAGAPPAIRLNAPAVRVAPHALHGRCGRVPFPNTTHPSPARRASAPGAAGRSGAPLLWTPVRSRARYQRATRASSSSRKRLRSSPPP
jgi:trans-2,3-dihydro-3-hydroxyanthranilate isomerase